VQRVILTVLTAVTFFHRLFRLESDYARGQNMGRNIFLGWSDRHGSGGNEAGSLQPNTVFCPCPKSMLASRATSATPTTSVHRGGKVHHFLVGYRGLVPKTSTHNPTHTSLTSSHLLRGSSESFFTLAWSNSRRTFFRGGLPSLRPSSQTQRPFVRGSDCVRARPRQR
jgi:hypothetical protein